MVMVKGDLYEVYSPSLGGKHKVFKYTNNTTYNRKCTIKRHSKEKC